MKLGASLTATLVLGVLFACRPPGAGMDCHQGNSCRVHGECSPQEQEHGWVCAAGNAESCAASEGCENWGACGLPASSCMPTAAAHCEASKACADHGACTFATGSACEGCYAAVPEDAYEGYSSYGLRTVGAAANNPGVESTCCCPEFPAPTKAAP